jgi:hypothetical protein
MDYSPFSEDRTPRLTNSPAGTPRLVQAPVSPVQSIHLDMMQDSQHNLSDSSNPRGDFFDSSSDEDEESTEPQAATPVLDQQRGRRRSSSPKKGETGYLGGAMASDYVSRCHTESRLFHPAAKTNPTDMTRLSNGASFEPNENTRPSLPPNQIFSQGKTITPDEFLRLTHSPGHSVQNNHFRPPPAIRTDSWYEDEVSTPVETEARPISLQAPGPGRLVHHSSPRGSTIIETNDTEQSAAIAAVEATNIAIKDIHTQTIQALLRNEESLQGGVNRISFLQDSQHRPAPRPPTKKRVSLAPPPIEVGSYKGSVPDDIVRTPYPFFFRKNYQKSSHHRAPVSFSQESILTLSIRGHTRNSTCPRRVSRISIPANVDAIPSKMCSASDNTKEKHFQNLDFDDAHFFREVRKSYQRLAGPFRILSARTLRDIEVSHSVVSSDSCFLEYSLSQAPASLCTHGCPRSPRFLASRGLTDSFSAAELMRHYRNPKIGKARYAWVHWARRMALPSNIIPAQAPPAASPVARLATETTEIEPSERANSCMECAMGLDFVEGWCAWRISFALVTVIICALAGALCWILLGTSFSFERTGIRNAGERVQSGCLIGVFVLMIGWSGVLGWLGLSWLVD